MATETNLRAKALDPKGATKAERRCWGAVTVDAAGTYEVLVKFPDDHTEQVATIAFGPASKRMGVLRVRAYADEVDAPSAEPVVGPGGL